MRVCVRPRTRLRAVFPSQCVRSGPRSSHRDSCGEGWGVVIYYVCIGNSDDKLSQREWSNFIDDVDEFCEVGFHTHGRWFSAPDVQWQSACWCIEGVLTKEQ